VLTRTFVGTATLLLLCALAALARGFLHMSSTTTTPPDPDDAKAWVWVGASPGMSIYFSPRGKPRRDALVSGWVERRFARTSSSIDKSLIELRDFDCLRGLSRRTSGVNRYRDMDGREQLTTFKISSEWVAARHGSIDERILLAACNR
jgi:hypothetical protein